MATRQPTASETETQASGEGWAAVARDFVSGRAGDDAAYRSALHAIAGRVRGWVARRTLGRLQPASIEDVVQECLLAVHTKAATYHEDAPLAPWVLGIARYKLADHARAHRIAPLPLEDCEERAELSSSEDIDSSLDVERLLRRLPEKQRYAIAQTRLLGDSMSDAAHPGGQSVASLKVNVHRGLKALAAYVRRRPS